MEARPLKRRRYGLEWMDEYSWMEANGPEMQRHLKQESEYAEVLMPSGKTCWAGESGGVREEGEERGRGRDSTGLREGRTG